MLDQYGNVITGNQGNLNYSPLTIPAGSPTASPLTLSPTGAANPNTNIFGATSALTYGPANTPVPVAQPVPTPIAPNPITPASLKATTPINIPPTPVISSGVASVNAGQAEIDALQKQAQAESVRLQAQAQAYNQAQAESVRLQAQAQAYNQANKMPDWMAQYLSANDANKPVNPIDAYNTALESSGANQLSQTTIDEQNKLTALNAQLAGLNAEANAIPIRIQQEAIGRGQTAGGIAPIQTAQLRDIALRILPVQAQVLAQQAVVTNNQNLLKSAQDKLDTVFKMQSDYQTQLYNYQKDQRAMIYDQLNKEEQQQINTMQKADDRKYQTYRDNISLAQNAASEAIKNYQSSLAGAISALNPSDPGFMQKLGTLRAQIKINQEQSIVQDLSVKYPDAGIMMNDTLAQAQAKLQNSKIYQNSVRLLNGGGGAGTAPVDIKTTLYSVGLPQTIVSTKGQLTNTYLTKLQTVGIDPTSAQEIMDKILAGTELKDVRQWMRDLNVDPKVLDDFMTTLQGVKTTSQPSQEKLVTSIDFNTL